MPISQEKGKSMQTYSYSPAITQQTDFPYGRQHTPFPLFVEKFAQNPTHCPGFHTRGSSASELHFVVLRQMS